MRLIKYIDSIDVSLSIFQIQVNWKARRRVYHFWMQRGGPIGRHELQSDTAEESFRDKLSREMRRRGKWKSFRRLLCHS